MWQQIFIALSKWGPLPAILLQVMLLSRFVDRRNRDYPIAIVFTVILFLLSAFTYAVNLNPQLMPAGRSTEEILAITDLTMHILLLTLMLQLTKRTLESLSLNANNVWILAALSLAVLVVSYSVFNDKGLAVQFLRIRQTVSFWMVLLNLYWWTLLLRRRKIDRRTMLLSAGIGLIMTGQTIGDGIFSNFGRPHYNMMSLAVAIMYFTNYACLYAWFTAFHPVNAAPIPAPELAESTKPR